MNMEQIYALISPLDVLIVTGAIYIGHSRGLSTYELFTVVAFSLTYTHLLTLREASARAPLLTVYYISFTRSLDIFLYISFPVHLILDNMALNLTDSAEIMAAYDSVLNNELNWCVLRLHDSSLPQTHITLQVLVTLS